MPLGQGISQGHVPCISMAKAQGLCCCVLLGTNFPLPLGAKGGPGPSAVGLHGSLSPSPVTPAWKPGPGPAAGDCAIWRLGLGLGQGQDEEHAGGLFGGAVHQQPPGAAWGKGGPRPQPARSSIHTDIFDTVNILAFLSPSLWPLPSPNLLSGTAPAWPGCRWSPCSRLQAMTWQGPRPALGENRGLHPCLKPQWPGPSPESLRTALLQPWLLEEGP